MGTQYLSLEAYEAIITQTTTAGEEERSISFKVLEAEKPKQHAARSSGTQPSGCNKV